MRSWFWKGCASVLVLGCAIVGAGQAGLFAGHPPDGLGLQQGRLAPPSNTRNSVSSQASLFPDHPQRSYAAMEPLRIQGDAGQAMRNLAGVLQAQPRIRIVVQDASYLRAEARTRWLGFTDDLEFVLDAPAGVIHFRSASRWGREDMGVNRARMEEIRARWTS